MQRDVDEHEILRHYAKKKKLSKKDPVKKSDNFIKMICKSHFHKFTHFHFTNEPKKKMF